MMRNPLLAALVLLTSNLAAQGNTVDYSVQFVGASASTYDHTRGGGAYNDGALGSDVDTVIPAAEFTPGEIVRYFAVITAGADAGESPRAVELHLNFDAASSAQPGAALSEIIATTVNYGCVPGGAAPCAVSSGGTDIGIEDDGGSVAALVSQSYTAPLFSAGSTLETSVVVSDLEPNETVVVAIDARLSTRAGTVPSGSLSAELTGARVLGIADGLIPIEPQVVELVGIEDMELPTSVITDRQDYLPGETAFIQGSGFAAGEVVELDVSHTDETPDDGEGHNVWAVVADARGAFQTTWTVCTDDCLGEVLKLSATGQDSEREDAHFFADDEIPGLDNGCMEDVAGFGLNCTANDIQIATVFNLTVLDDGCAFPGDTVELEFSVELLLTAQARHDVGIYFATDGGDALTGVCRIEVLPHDGPFDVSAFCEGVGDPFPCCTGAGTGCTGTYTDLDGLDDDPAGVLQDECGDIDEEPNPLFTVIGPLTLNCIDTDDDGFLDVASCLSWRQPGANDLCTLPDDAFPGSPSKCRCEEALAIPIELPGRIDVDKVTVDSSGAPLPGDPTVFGFSITGADADLPDNFTLDDDDAPHQSPGLDAPNPTGADYTVTETNIPAGWTLLSANCVSDKGNPDQDPTAGPVTVFPDEILTCTFTNRLDLMCPPDVTIDCDESTDPAVNTSLGTPTGCQETPTFDDVVSGDLCSGITITRTWTCGTATCEQIITVNPDTTAPEITCPADVSVQCSDDIPPVDTGAVTTSDDCTSVVVTHEGDVSDNNSCPEVITRTYRATDSCGNFTECQQLITIDDTTPPQITCPADVTAQCVGDVPPPNTGLVTATDNCGSVAVTHVGDVPSGSCPLVITRTYRATDDCGNTADCTQTITIDDTTPPQITCPGDVTVQCVDDVPDADIALVTATDNCGTATVTHVGDSSNGDCPLVITRTYRATDSCGNTADCTQTITVDDTTPPQITCPGDVTVQCADDVPDADIALVTATDNCGTATVTHVGDSRNGDCPLVITRTYRATDDCGNTADCTQTITVDDTTPPQITCPGDVTVQCADDIPAPDISSVTATDNCGTATVTHVGDSRNGDCPLVVTRTYRATDSCGNTADCTQTITVDDTTPPQITCPADVTVQCADDVPDPDISFVTATDNCGTPTVTHVGDSRSGECPVVISRTYRATDSCGNTSECVQSITIDDTTGPEITCPADTTVECIDDVPDPDISQVTATDNCGSVTVTHVGDAAGGECPLTILRTYRATDGCGNIAECVQTITVDDTTPPQITCPADVEVQCGDDVPAPDIAQVTATDNCGTPTVTHVGDVRSGTCPTTITRTYRATDACGNTADCTQTITVNDTTPPIITCPADVDVQCADDIPAPDPATVTATDNCGALAVIHVGDVRSGSCPTVITRTYRATDACGNTSECTQTITVDDTTAPEITCPADVLVSCDGDIPAPNIGLVVATDNCGTPTVTHVGDVRSGSCPTIVTRTYRATDACGNTADCTQTITVSDTTPPLITCPADVLVSCDDDVPPANTNDVVATDNCGPVTVIHVGDSSSGNCRRTITRTYRATDACGNSSECTQTITVNDVTPPRISCPADLLIECDDAVPAPDISLVTASDNCGSVTVTHVGDETTGTCPLTITRTYRATDDCGNTADCTQNITVNDTTPPTITCPRDLQIECDSSVPAPDPTSVVASDNCGAVQVTHVGDVGSGSACRQTILRTYRATDSCGNTADCTQTITLADTTPPVLVCPEDLTFVGCTPEQTCEIDPAESGMATATDNCTDVGDIFIGYDDIVIGDCPKMLIRTWTAIDQCGNESFCEQFITCLPPGGVTSSALCTFDTNSKDGSQFNLNFTPDGRNPAYKITSTNPGQFFYNAFWSGDPGDPISFDFTIPYPFVTQGRNPLHIYDGVSIDTQDGELCFIPGNAIETPDLEITLDDYSGLGTTYSFSVNTTIPATGSIYVNVHLDFGLKGRRIDSLPDDGVSDRYDIGPCAPDNPDGTSAGCDALFDESAEGVAGETAIPNCTSFDFSHDVNGLDAFDDVVQNLNIFHGGGRRR